MPKRVSYSDRAEIDVLLGSPPRLNIWRAATDNDGFKLIGNGGTLGKWLKAGIDSKPAESLVQHVFDSYVDAHGAVIYDHTVVVPEELADLPRWSGL